METWTKRSGQGDVAADGQVPGHAASGIRADESTGVLGSAGGEDDMKTYVVIEYCSECEREVEIHGWDTSRDGYQAFCPYCGSVLMLCDECQHYAEQTGSCDYDLLTGSCRRRKKG